MNNLSNREQEFLGGEGNTTNILWQYVQSMSPETVAQLSKPSSSEVFQIMESQIRGILGNLPPEGFGVTISTTRENLGRLLTSAMVSGYFLNNAEQRMALEKSLEAVSESTFDR